MSDIRRTTEEAFELLEAAEQRQRDDARQAGAATAPGEPAGTDAQVLLAGLNAAQSKWLTIDLNDQKGHR